MTLRELIAWGKVNDPHAPLILVYGLVGIALAAALIVLGE